MSYKFATPTKRNVFESNRIDQATPRSVFINLFYFYALHKIDFTTESNRKHKRASKDCWNGGKKKKTCGKSVKNCICLFPFLIISPIFFLSIVCRLHLLYNTLCTLCTPPASDLFLNFCIKLAFRFQLAKKCVFLLSFSEAHEMAIKVYEWDKNPALCSLFFTWSFLNYKWKYRAMCV